MQSSALFFARTAVQIQRFDHLCNAFAVARRHDLPIMLFAIVFPFDPMRLTLWETRDHLVDLFFFQYRMQPFLQHFVLCRDKKPRTVSKNGLQNIIARRRAAKLPLLDLFDGANALCRVYDGVARLKFPLIHADFSFPKYDPMSSPLF